MNKLILATNNRDKINEIKYILSDVNIEILSVADFDDFPDIKETGKTLAENAILKARAIWERYRLPCLADDTGLEVDYLDGAPGIFSARFAGPGCTYDANNRKLLQLLKGVPKERRTARFKTVIAFADDNGVIQTVEGTIDGIIGFEPTGKYGFGYDPVFIVTKRGISMAELRPEEKNSISHRSLALRKIKPIIVKAISGR